MPGIQLFAWQRINNAWWHSQAMGRIGLGFALLLGLCVTLQACTDHTLRPALATKAKAAIAALKIPPDATVLVGAGDIAECEDLAPANATASLIAAIIAVTPEARVITMGDHVYPDGTIWQFNHCYEPTWGRFNSRTYPAPGNHDYNTPGAKAYFDYFIFFDRHPDARPAGYYSYDIQNWHIVALNSATLDQSGSKQLKWLANDLASAPTSCVLAYWHQPLFSSGRHGFLPFGNKHKIKLYWKLLLQYGGDIIVNGHEHLYERFAPQNARGERTPRGIRQFIVGTGGADLYSVISRKTNSVYVNNDIYGVLILILHSNRVQWAFLGVDGIIYDRGTAPMDCSK